MSFQMYRSTVLGKTLDSVLCDLINDGQIPHQLYGRIMASFDKAICYALENRIRAKTQIQADKLLTYRFVDNVWVLVLESVDFNHPLMYNQGQIDRVKIVACDASILKRRN